MSKLTTAQRQKAANAIMAAYRDKAKGIDVEAVKAIAQDATGVQDLGRELGTIVRMARLRRSEQVTDRYYENAFLPERTRKRRQRKKKKAEPTQEVTEGEDQLRRHVVEGGEIDVQVQQDFGNGEIETSASGVVRVVIYFSLLLLVLSAIAIF